MSIVQAIIASISNGASVPPANTESGTPGSNQVYLTNVPPSSGTTWTSLTGPDATVVGSYTFTTSPNNGIILDSGSYISVPLNLNQGYWTVELVCDLNPTGYWATMWGNELYNSQIGYFVYQGNPTQLSVGSPSGTNSYDTGSINGTRNYWVFTNNGGVISVYKNGQLLSASSGYGYVPPQGAGPGTILFGARHDNGNSSAATDMTPGTFYFMEIRDYAVDQTYVTDKYNNNVKITYQLP